MYKRYIKRIIDIVLSAILSILLLPIASIVFVVVLISLGWPVFFVQNRVTLHERPFKIIKFRTMKPEKNKYGEKLSDDERSSKVGNAIRSLSVDELPELINILKGDLSFVGPRPLYTEYLPYYSEEEKKRHTVRGGLIPPDCFEGTVNVTWDKQLMWEAWYAENVSLWVDIKVVLLTFKIVLKRVLHGYGAERRVSLIEERNYEIKGN